ncbi:MAG: hypothetical protein ACI91Z_000049 [Yoonia sp.]|jgi:hypothetical protein
MPDPIDQTPLLSLPYIQGAQAQKHVTHNAALELIDMVAQLAVEALDATTPPTSAAEGQAWAVGASPSGAWSSHAGDIAAWRGGGWLFVTPVIGWRAWDKTTGAIYAYDGAGWIAAGGVADLQNLDGLGINAASDTTNRLAVSSAATLLNHDGAGHQVKINKATATDTASLLYQSGFSGRAEMGLAGNDDFSVKVSGDGTTFTEALRINGATGAVAMPTTGTRQLIAYNYRYYVYTDRRWIAPSSNPGILNATQALGIGPEPTIDWDGKGLYLPAGSMVNAFTLAGNTSNGEINDLDLRIWFQYGPWDVSWSTAAETTRTVLYSGDAAGIIGADGYLIVGARADASSTLTETRYFYSASVADITLPPSV